MNINQMEYAIALAEYKKFSEVSKHLYVAQSSISKQICLLEEEFGIRLFERLKSGTELTPEGRIIIDAFKRSRETVDEAVSRAKYMCDCGGALKIGVSEGFETCPALLRTLKALREKHRNVEVTVQSFHHSILANKFNHDQLDMIINTASELPGRNWECERLWYNEYALVLPAGHLVAGGVPMHQYDFSHDTVWIAHHEGGEMFRSYIQGVKELLRVDDSVIRYARDLDSMLACVEAGLGITVAPWMRRMSFCPDLRLLPVDNTGLPSLQMCAVWKRKNPNPAVSDFVRLLREYMTETGE
ncbi:MAG: LysR family transcriptional regulator [Oscillospiraceae bacterium]|nr:LysR family transcriptional regulator [Oscillospiraceae bacterium]